MPDRMRILLVDDLPRFTWDLHRGARLPAELREHFELIWVQNAVEARWLLEAFEILSLRAPHELLDIGLPPELLIFDYALTQGGEARRPESDSTYVVHAIRQLLDKYNIDLSAASPQELEDPPSTGTALGSDHTGCYVGGEFARVFAAHPCGAVPTTARVDTSESDAAFYEWLNRQCFMDLFKYKSRTNPTWEELLPPAVQCLRQRIVQLAAAGIIRIQLSPLQQLAETPSSMKHGSLIIHSRFGQRDLPIQGLFADSFLTGKDEGTFIATVQEWAGRVLFEIFKGHGQEEFFEAKELAKQYWQISQSEAAFERDNLSTLAARRDRSDNDENRLRELCKRVGVDFKELQEHPDKVRVANPDYVLQKWRDTASSHVVARWVALLLAVRAEHSCPTENKDAEDFESVLTEEEREVGEISPQALESRVGNEAALRMIESLELVYSEETGLIEFELPLEKAAEIGDILIALDPLPESSVFLYKHKKRSSDGRRVSDKTFLTNPLKRLGHTIDGWGPLGLNLSDVLKDRPFDCELCRAAIEEHKSPPCGEHEDQKKNKFSHGIRKGEGPLLRIFADEIGFKEWRWPPWLKHAP